MDFIAIKGEESKRLTDEISRGYLPPGTFLIHLRNAGEECPRTRREENRETVQQERNITNRNKRSYHVVPRISAVCTSPVRQSGRNFSAPVSLLLMGDDVGATREIGT
ncbi:MAG: hypothetical protein OEM42_09515 [Deltaproteobacteria bacterium]|nr:hypothetical protein [Deltaproteobacteria bacterium]